MTLPPELFKQKVLPSRPLGQPPLEKKGSQGAVSLKIDPDGNVHRPPKVFYITFTRH